MAWLDQNINKDVQVLIAIPKHEGGVDFEWAMNFAQLRRDSPPHKVFVPVSYNIDVARNTIFDTAIAMNIPYVFMIDSDMIVGSDTIHRLLRLMQPNAKPKPLDIVGILYARRYPPFFNEMLLQRPEGTIPISEGEYPKGDVIKVDCLGTGGVMFRMSTIKEIERPWFIWSDYYAPGQPSEDFEFFRRIKRRHQIEVYCHTGIIGRHCTTSKVLPSIGSVGFYEFPQNIGLWD